MTVHRTAVPGSAISEPVLPPALSEATRATIDTPALVVDLDRMDAAIVRMADAMSERAVALRPHAKTHKSIEVGRRQVGAGAAGLTVGTVGEAEVFADGGLDDLFIAYPMVPAGPKAERLREVARRARLRVGIDSVVGAHAVADALGDDRERVSVLVEIDCGGRRTGVAPSDAGPVAAAATHLGLDVIGVFTHGGHGYHGPDARAAAAEDEVRGLTEAAGSLRAAGLEPSVVSAGSTPTAFDSARGAVTEERPGTYVFGDRQQVALGSIAADAPAAVIAARVVSLNTAARRFVIDAGAKTLTKDVPAYLAGHASIPELGAVVDRVSDYHGVVEVKDGGSLPEIGQVVLAVPNHICPVVDLFATFLVARDGAIIDTWRVDARGRSG
ncbi:MAG TPA: alanine racemase [Patescibacteria group bacterium]|nr:alanine racemase [Patescibacteria group bacterium]